MQRVPRQSREGPCYTCYELSRSSKSKDNLNFRACNEVNKHITEVETHYWEFIDLETALACINYHKVASCRPIYYSISKVTVHKHLISPSWTVWKSLNVLLTKTVYCSQLYGKLNLLSIKSSNSQQQGKQKFICWELVAGALQFSTYVY